jgi:hypothetical protein
MRKLKFNDFYPNSDDEAIFIIKTFLGNHKKIIVQNYSKHNFALIKKQWPLFWSYVKNKSFFINRKNSEFF